MYGQKKKKRHVGPSQHWNIRLSSSITDTATIDDDGQQDTFMFDKEGHKRSVRHPAMRGGDEGGNVYSQKWADYICAEDNQVFKREKKKSL
jgi:hypothetical protein